jgi:hypothetical protein
MHSKIGARRFSLILRKKFVKSVAEKRETILHHTYTRGLLNKRRPGSLVPRATGPRRSLREKISRGGENLGAGADINNAGTTTTP